MSYQWNFSLVFSVRPCKIDSHVRLILATKSKNEEMKTLRKKGMYTLIYEKSLQKAVLLKSGLLKRKIHVKTESNPQARIQVLIKRKLTHKKSQPKRP